MTDYKATGGCLCGGVKYELSKPLKPVLRCHCTICRRAIGADFGTFGGISMSDFKLLKKDTLQEYRSSETVIRSFCGVCGASLFDKGPDPDEKEIFLILGCLDGDPGVSVDYHIFARDKAPWVKIDDGLPKCDGMELVNFDDVGK